MSFKYIISVIILFLSLNTWGQNNIELQISIEDKNITPIKHHLKTNYQSSFEIHIALKQYIKELHHSGYLSASLDSITGDSLNKTAHFFIGSKYEWTTLNTDSIDDEILSNTGFRNKQYLNKPFSIKQISNFFNQTLSYLENTGYPFAEIQLSDIETDSSNINATIKLTKNQFYKIDSIQIIGEQTRLNKHYIENIIGIQTNDNYNEQIIKDISKRIQENPFMNELKPYEVIFTDNSCKLLLVLKPQKSNIFDGIIGAQPQANSSKITFTGDIKISLGNIIGQGERLNLRWQKLQDQTQQIDAAINVPFLFKTPIGFGYDLNIYRRDTTFNNVHHRFTIPYRMPNGSEFYGFYDDFSTSLISTTGFNSLNISPYNDAKNTLYGIGFIGSYVKNKYNPYSGWLIELNGGAGTNKIIKNSNLESISYDSSNLESTLLQGDISLSYFQPVTKQTTLLLRVRSGSKQTDNLVENQAYRIGGLSTLRGFDEQSIFTSSYAIGSLEYRLLFDEYSRLSLFYDWAWYELATYSKFTTDTPFSFGAGISFSTNTGIFSLNYALGSQFNNPINFRSGKIHFGFVNIF